MQDKFELYNDDCFKVMDEFITNNTKVDCVLTDPPYGIDFVSGRRKEKYNKIKNDDSLIFLNEFFFKCNEVLKDNSHIYCFCSWHNVDKFKVEFEKYFKLKNILIWEKNNKGMGDLKGSYAPKYEMVLFGHKGRRENEGSRQVDVIKAKKTGNKLHPTQKPTDLLEILIKNSTKENEIILDCFMGSGSTGVACMNTNRRFVGIEIEENYFNIAKNRIENK